MKSLCGPILLALCLTSFVEASAAQRHVEQIAIRSSWGGLGNSSNTELAIRDVRATYKLNGHKIDSGLITSLVSALDQPAISAPDMPNLGITKEWLEAAVQTVPGKSLWRELTAGDTNQKELFRRSFTNPEVVGKALPSLFTFSRTDDYPHVEVVVTFEDGSTVTASSDSQYLFMLPWKITTASDTFSTFNANISRAIAVLMPQKTTNKERIAGRNLDVNLADTVMQYIEADWKSLGVEDKIGSDLALLRTKYIVRGADINSYHEVAYGLKWNKGGPYEENVHALVVKNSFPPGFDESVILLFSAGRVSGVENFLQSASRYEDLALSVPWVNSLREKYPQWTMTLLWVHDRSFSEKAMGLFADDMHSMGKDQLAEEVRSVQTDVALMTINYGDWWIVLPDRRMVLWRYSSVSGLLNLNRTEIASKRCTDYQTGTGGCVGAVVGPDGTLIK